MDSAPASCSRAGIADRLQRFKGAHQCLAAHRADAFDIIQDRVYLAFAAQAAVVLDRKAVRLVLNARDQLEAFGVRVDRDFHVVVVEAACAVEIILYHTADRNVDAELLQHPKRDVDLAAAAVHQDQIRGNG